VDGHEEVSPRCQEPADLFHPQELESFGEMREEGLGVDQAEHPIRIRQWRF
jgi:hypothetical protein